VRGVRVSVGVCVCGRERKGGWVRARAKGRRSVCTCGKESESVRERELEQESTEKQKERVRETERQTDGLCTYLYHAHKFKWQTRVVKITSLPTYFFRTMFSGVLIVLISVRLFVYVPMCVCVWECARERAREEKKKNM